MPLPPPSSKKHREPPRELATVCQKGNMLAGNVATEKFDLPRRLEKDFDARDHFGIVQAGPRGNSQRSAVFSCRDHALRQSLAPGLQMTASVTLGIRSGFADASARWPIVPLLHACRRGGARVRSSPDEDRSGVLRSVVDLQAAINRFLEEDNRRSAPSGWTAGLNKIIAAVRRGR
jgi:hypothetical protein